MDCYLFRNKLYSELSLFLLIKINLILKLPEIRK